MSNATIGNIQSSDITAWGNIDVGNNLYVRSGLNVGVGGIYSNGPLSVSVASTTQSNPVSAYFQGLVGVATTTPWRTLSVTGNVGLDGLTGSTGAGSLCLSANKEVVYNSGSDNCLSSLRATKHDIIDLTVSGTSSIAALQPVSFVYNDDASSTVRYGFIAEDTAAVDPHLATYDQNGNISGVDDRAVLSIIVKALQELIATVSGFAQNFATQTLVADNGTFKQITTDKLCVTKADGSPVCITGDGLDQILTNESVSPASSATPALAPPAPTAPTVSTSSNAATSATTTTDAPSIVPDYTASTTLPVSSEATTSPTVDEATSTQ
jgi:hypothetical protein